MNTTMNKTFTAALLYVVGTQVEIQYTAVRVHVPRKCYIVHTLQQQTATAVVINSVIASC